MKRVIGYTFLHPNHVMTREEATEIVNNANAKWGYGLIVVELREVTTCVWTSIDDGHNTACGVTGVEVTYERGTDSTTFCPFCGGHVEVAS